MAVQAYIPLLCAHNVKCKTEKMTENLVIVESPAKAKTIEKFLGKDFHVTSSFGHIRDLAKKNLGIQIDNRFEPEYIVPDEKKKVVSELRKKVKESKTVWLASDEDREGEAIAWHLTEVLKLDRDNTQRIVFHEITKNAIQNAIDTPRRVDMNLVYAQQARRVLDRLVGFEISPILWRKVQPSLSAGRVQSVAVRLLVEREREVLAFQAESSYKITALFTFISENGKEGELKAELSKKFKEPEEAEAFLEHCKQASFSISDIVVKPGKKSPAAPFTTSTLQQEASRKLGFSVSQTMRVAQKLYEAGQITYMRTDSTNLSGLALSIAQKTIEEEYGPEYSKVRQFRTKAKGAQEAHEAIRPTYLDKKTVGGSQTEKRLYDLIWKRTIASQMSEAKLEKTTASIQVENRSERFVAQGEVILFDGFLKVYTESTDEENNGIDQPNLLPPIKEGMPLTYREITAEQKFTSPPPRYTEASLVKKMEELGIGRPSTYAPTISTIQQRGYVVREDRPGQEREVIRFMLKENQLQKSKKTEVSGREKSKLFPNDIGMVVNDFLIEHFPDILDYHFTAHVEKQFDEIAEGKIEWADMLQTFYRDFHPKVEETLEHSERKKGERVLGEHPETGEPVMVKIGRFGPVAQIGDAQDDKKPRFASLQKGQLIETISLEEALDLFKLPRELGDYEDEKLVVGLGRFGPYVRHKSKFFSLKKGMDDPMTITRERAIELIEEKREQDRKKVIARFEGPAEIRVLNGRYGPYISYEGKNYRIPKSQKPENLTAEGCMELIEKAAKKPKK